MQWDKKIIEKNATTSLPLLLVTGLCSASLGTFPIIQYLNNEVGDWIPGQPTRRADSRRRSAGVQGSSRAAGGAPRPRTAQKSGPRVPSMDAAPAVRVLMPGIGN